MGFRGSKPVQKMFKCFNFYINKVVFMVGKHFLVKGKKHGAKPKPGDHVNIHIIPV